MSQAALRQTYQDPLQFSEVLKTCTVPDDVANYFSRVRLPFELMPHQVRNLQCGLAWDRFGLFDHPRTGKTIVMQLLAVYYRAFGLRTVVIMPPILFTQFKTEFMKIEGHGLSVEMLTGSSAQKEDTLQAWAVGQKEPPDVLMLSKELFSGPHHKKTNLFRYADYLQKVFSIVQWDECHQGLQSETSAIFRTVEKYIDTVPGSRLVLSTGTPSTNNLQATFPTIRLKTPDAYISRRHFDNSHVVFRDLYVASRPTAHNPSGVRRVSVVDHYVDQDLLNKNLYDKAVRSIRHEVLGIETPNIQVLPITLDPSHLNFYKKVLKDRLVEIETDMVDLRQEQKLRQFALRIITSPEFGGGSIKQNAVVQAVQTLIDSVNLDEEKVIVFANFNNSVEYLSQKLKDYNPAVIYGPQGSEKNRTEAQRFTDDKTCQVAVINPQAGGVGYTFGHVCQTVIFAEPVSTPGLFEQAASRILLKGQTEPVTVYILKVLDTVSPRAIDAMINKTAELQEVMRDKKTLIDELLPKK